MNTKRVVPTVFAYDSKMFDKKLQLLKFAEELHIDFMDGKFTEKKSVSLDDMSNIKNYSEIRFSIHLMVNEPLEYIGKVKKLGIDTIFFHYEVFETDTELQYAITTFKEKGFEVGLVLNPSTPVEDVLYYADEIDKVMLMGVWPGKEGQEFISHTYEKIKELKEELPKIEVLVDGGVNLSNVKEISDSGCDVLCVGSCVSGNDNPKEVYDELLKEI